MSVLFQDHRLEDLHTRLLAFYGKPPERVVWDPLKQFIYSMLSSRTKTEISHEVLRHLWTTFGSWEGARDAPIAAIEDAIRLVTFPEQKAIWLKDALEQITARYGSLTLDFLRPYRTDKIRTWLERFDGVGTKTSAAVVNFSTLRRRAMCVDSHHLRITQRLGFVPGSADARETEDRIMDMAPATWSAEMLDEHHSLVKLHGQQICLKNGPACTRCPLLEICPTGSANGVGARKLAHQG
jgi:endonuclease-3